MARARIVDPEEGPRSKRAAILVAAVERFGEDGYESTKWSEVADRVRDRQTALYHYFESKAHCLLTIMRLELQRSHDMFTEATADAVDPVEELRAAVRSAFAVSEKEIGQMRDPAGEHVPARQSAQVQARGDRARRGPAAGADGRAGLDEPADARHGEGRLPGPGRAHPRPRRPRHDRQCWRRYRRPGRSRSPRSAR